MYGSFTSNVDMSSGAPAFGTPEYIRATQISGQMARFYGLPLRASNACAAKAVGVDRFVGQCQRVVHAIEMTDRRMNIHGLNRITDHHVNAIEILRQLDQVPVTFSIADAAAAVQVRAIWGTADIAEQHAVTTDGDLPARASRRNVEFGRGFTHLLHDKVTIHSDVVTVRADGASSFAENLLRFVVEELDTDLFEYSHGSAVNRIHGILVERFRW